HAIVEKSGGNPLYASFLGRQAIEHVRAGLPAAPSAMVEALPLPAGDLAAYYEYLLAGAEDSPDAGSLAEHLAVIEFAVTIDELVTLLPALGRNRIEAALSHLRPILVDIGGQ